MPDELGESVIERRDVAQGKVIRFEQLKVRLPDGAESTRDVVRHPGGCVIVPIGEDGSLYLVRQYRVAIGAVTLEFPAGKLEPGEPPEACARRELLEETGFSAGSMRRVLSVCSTPGFCDEIIHVFIAEQLAAGAPSPDEGEFVKLERMRLDALMGMVRSGGIMDAKTVIGILLADGELAGRRG
ncbi:MAG: NUDIX hydrolase [Clostridiales bacterium]|nr:NUDIX hydrolase [Clostridiales bacterium]